MDATADVLELRQIRAGLGIGDVSTVDLPAQTACDDHGLLGFVCGELLHEKEGRGVVRAQPFGLDVHLGFHGRMLVRGDPVQQDVLLPVDCCGGDVQYQPGHVAGHLFEILPAGLLFGHPESPVDVGRHDDGAIRADDADDHHEAKEHGERQCSDDAAENTVGASLCAQVVLVLSSTETSAWVECVVNVLPHEQRTLVTT